MKHDAAYYAKHKKRLNAKWKRWYYRHREQHIADVLKWQKVQKKHEATR